MSLQTFEDGFQLQTGIDFGSLVRAKAAILYDKVIYIDTERGSDGNKGVSTSKACKTINGAVDRIYSGNNDLAKGRNFALILQGRTTTGLAQTAMQAFDIEGMHLIGAGRWFGHGGGGDSCLVCGSSSGYASKTALKVTRSNCSVEGIKFYMPSEYALGSEESYIYATNPTDLAIVSCQFIGANADGDITNKYSTGILVEGQEGAVIAGNEFLYCYRGIKGMAGSSRYFHKGKIVGNAFFGCSKAVYLGDPYGIENLIARNDVLQKSGYGHAISSGIDLSGGPSGNLIRENFVGDESATVSYTKGAGANHWINNWYALSGGTKYAEE